MAGLLHANKYDRKSSPQSGVWSARVVPMRLASQPSPEGSESSSPPLSANESLSGADSLNMRK